MRARYRFKWLAPHRRARARILFSGDVGAALLPDDYPSVCVEDFDQVIKAATGFHRRWMGSNSAKLDWCERAVKMDIDMPARNTGLFPVAKMWGGLLIGLRN